MNASKTMAFVASAPRSGSTLLRLMLNAHPRIKTPGEFDFLFDLFGDDANCNSVGTASLDRFVEHLNQDRRFRALGASLPSKHSCDELIQHIVQHVSTDADVLVLNIHRNFLIAHELFPQATFIHLVRDPRDCAHSCVQMGWAGNVHYGVEFWMEAERSWDRVAKTVTKENAAELRFEDLVVQPDVELKRISDFMGIQYEPCMLEFRHRNYKWPDARKANQWRKSLREKEIRLVESKAKT